MICGGLCGTVGVVPAGVAGVAGVAGTAGAVLPACLDAGLVLTVCFSREYSLGCSAEIDLVFAPKVTPASEDNEAEEEVGKIGGACRIASGSVVSASLLTGKPPLASRVDTFDIGLSKSLFCTGTRPSFNHSFRGPPQRTKADNW